MVKAPKALATIAFLKIRLDEGHDHLGLFEPLILDALAHSGQQDFLATDLQPIIEHRTGLLVPTNTIQTLLGRFARRHFLYRAGGRFFRTEVALPESRLDETRQDIETQQAKLAEVFMTFAESIGVRFGTVENALAAIATFISDNKVSLVLDEAVADSPLERSSLDRKSTRAIARFITEQCSGSPILLKALSALTEGILLQDALLFRDIPEAAHRFQNLLVALDTGILFAALGLTGVSNAVAAKEGLSLLREAGARTIVFSRTIDELRQILAVYEQKLGTNAGRLSLHPTALTHHVLTSRMSPADMRVISSSLEAHLAKIGIAILDMPEHVASYTLNEEELAKRLASETRPDRGAPRVRHDVDCIAAVLTLRAGRTATSIERSLAILSSTSGRVIHDVQQWFFAEGEHGIPPMVHHVALTSIAWLKKPAAAPNVKLHELAAICVAVMRPTRQTWLKVIETLRKLRDAGTITDDETAAIVASELTEPLLARLDDDLEPDADSIEQAIARVTEDYRNKASAAANEVITKAQENVLAIQSAADEAVRAAKAEASLAQQAAEDALSKRDETLGNLERRIGRRAKIIANALFVITTIVVGVSAVLSIPGVLDVLSEQFKWTARVIVAIAAVVTLYITLQGGSLREFKCAVEDKIRQQIRTGWLSTPEERSSSLTALNLQSGMRGNKRKSGNSEESGKTRNP
jgi:hypothetical protein